MRKSLTALTAFGLLAACSPEPAPAPDKAKTDTIASQIATERPTLSLPAFPNWAKLEIGTSDNISFDIKYPTKSPYDFTRVLTGYTSLPTHGGKATLILPEATTQDNPVPAMVILHGSGGIKEGREFEYAKLFAANGIAAFIVDYYSPRGVTDATPYVMKTMAATEVDVISDAYNALNFLNRNSYIDPKRIGVTGYSYGGMGTRYVLDQRIKDIMAPDVPPFALHMDIYGPCHQDTGSWQTTGAPYLAIYGDNDNSVEPAACAKVQEQLRDGGSEVTAHIMPGAGHAWENDEPLTEFGGAYVRGCNFSWDKDTGVFLVDGQAGEFQPAPDMTREERAAVRASLGSLAGKCVSQGYIVGSNPETDKKSKVIQLEFMKRVFGL